MDAVQRGVRAMEGAQEIREFFIIVLFFGSLLRDERQIEHFQVVICQQGGMFVLVFPLVLDFSC